MTNKQHLLDFLQSQRALSIATQGKKGLWCANLYMGADDNGVIYFVSKESTEHSQNLLANPEVAFSCVWFNEQDHEDRKGVQGAGECAIATSDADIAKGIELHNALYPAFKERITEEWAKSDDNNSHVWVIRPKRMRYWDDALFGDKPYEDFTF